MVETLVGEKTWLAELEDLPLLELPRGPVVVLAPHPDDEVLAAGGLIALLRQQGIAVTVLALTDGDAAYDSAGDAELATTRRGEQERALGHLGVASAQILRYGFPDGRLADHEAQLKELVRAAICPETTVVAPWREDFHPDHMAAGRVAEAAAREAGAPLLRWFWWSWHQRTPEALAGLALRRLPLSTELRKLKQDALDEHRSQLGDGCILPDNLLAPARWPFEVFA